MSYALQATVLWEPLKLTAQKRNRGLGPFGWRPYVPLGATWPELDRFLDGVLTGRLIEPGFYRRWVWPDTRATKYLVKFCRANRLLPWMVRRWPHVKTIHLLRHPCAVVSSQLRHSGYRNMVDRFQIDRTPFAMEYHQPHMSFLDSLTHPEEILAATWALDHLPPLRDPESECRWITVTYEELVVDGAEVLRRVFATLGHRQPEDVKTRLQRQSNTTLPGSPILRGGNQLAGWKTHLTASQINRIMRVVEHFKLNDIYSADSLMPRMQHA